MGREGAEVGQVLKAGSGIGPNNGRIIDVEGAGGGGSAWGVGGDGEAGGIQAEIAGDVEDVMDDQVVIAAEGVGAGEQERLGAGRESGGDVGINEEDVIDVGGDVLIHHVSEAGAPEVDVAFGLDDEGVDEVGNFEKAVGAAEVKVGERSGNLGVAAAEELVGGL